MRHLHNRQAGRQLCTALVQLVNGEQVDNVTHSLDTMPLLHTSVSAVCCHLRSDAREDGSAGGRCLTVTRHLPLIKRNLYGAIAESRIHVQFDLQSCQQNFKYPILISVFLWQGL